MSSDVHTSMIFLFSAFTLLLALAATGAAGLALLYTRRNSAILFRLSKEHDSAGRQSEPVIRALSSEIERLSERIHVVESKSVETRAVSLVSGLGSREDEGEAIGGRETPHKFRISADDTTYMPDAAADGQTGRSPGSLRRNSGLGSGVNYTRRARAMKFLRRGDSPEQVAAALEMPLSDVKLLAKVRLITASTQTAALQAFNQNPDVNPRVAGSFGPLPGPGAGAGVAGVPGSAGSVSGRIGVGQASLISPGGENHPNAVTSTEPSGKGPSATPRRVMRLA